MPRAERYTEFTPDDYPSFPDSPEFPSFELETISLRKLLDNDRSEQDRVFSACKLRGFFYLELAGCERGETISRGADDMCRLAEKAFALPLEEKQRFPISPPNRLDGQVHYKRAGATKTDKSGTPDTAEFFNVGKDDFTLPRDADLRHPWPDEIARHRPLFDTYIRAAHATCLTVMDVLADGLGIDRREIRDRHRLERPSGDHVRLTRGPPRRAAAMPEIQTPSHTDFGTITLLVNWLGGLQIYSAPARTPGSLEPDQPGEWQWVKPRRGCAIVNLGDASVRFTNGVLCSGRHRVVPAPGEQGMWPRYSVVYFVRPEDDCILKRLDGDGVPPLESGEEDGDVKASDWIMRQVQAMSAQK